MKNAAGDYFCYQYIPVELATAGITPVPQDTINTKDPEVTQYFTGELCGWTFRRAWYYWVCKGPALPFKYANPLYNLIGKEVRASGDCACRPPEFWYKDMYGVDFYHIDTQEGLNIFAAVLRKWQRDVLEEKEVNNGL